MNPTHTPLATVAEQTRLAGEVGRLWTEASANYNGDQGRDAAIGAVRPAGRARQGGGGGHAFSVCPVGALTPLALVLPGESAPFASNGAGLVVDLNTQNAMVLAPAADAYPTASIKLEWFRHGDGYMAWRWSADGSAVIQGLLSDDDAANPVIGVYPGVSHGSGAYSAQANFGGMVITGAGTLGGAIDLPVQRGNDQWLSPYTCFNDAPGRVLNEGQDHSGDVALHFHLRALLASGSVVAMSFPVHFKALRVGKANS